MGTEQTNPYQAYTDGSIFSDNPLNLVVALYEGAITATRQAEAALQARDIWGRSKAINKAIAILTELLVSLDHERGGEISQNLKKLYDYMQVRLLEAHARQKAEPIVEVAGLLSTLLDGWRQAGLKQAGVLENAVVASEPVGASKQFSASAVCASAAIYGGYMDDMAGSMSGTAYSF
jgi:flagellar protein FliS